MEDLLLKANHEDVNSYANFDKMRQENINIIANIDFKNKQMNGQVEIKFKVLNIDETRVILDAKGVNVSKVIDQDSGQELKFSFYNQNLDKDALGTPLIILLNNETKREVNSIFTLSIHFSTTEDSLAIQWLNAEQTLSKKYPFMFTQCEAILARTLIPCQDSPSAKTPVSAHLTVEKPLTALFSGIEDKVTEERDLVTYHYSQKIPIPTYLIAIAAGELEYGKLSERCGVWTEVGLRDKAVWEFAHTEDYLKTAENYLTPYVWGVYNILVLPFAFPYGGMENPCLTFVTPALIAGDRSLTMVIAHEIAHSWTGNLVTNKDWGNFWMNEGFTVFMERKICELMDGEDMAILEANVGKGELNYAIESFGTTHNYTSLAPDYSNVDPDDGFSVVPYEKGFTLLYYLESLVGKKNFQSIMQDYIKKFSYQSISFNDWREIFEEKVNHIYQDKAKSEVLSKIDWDAWVLTPGYPNKDIPFRKIFF